MGTESDFVAEAHELISKIVSKPLCVERGAPLLYQVSVDNNLALTVRPEHPVRGNGAFQTDLCVFEAKSDVKIPRVVFEFKGNPTTHDVITYSVKARRHKQVYPYLRYGFVVSKLAAVPGLFSVHNELLDFCAAMANVAVAERHDFFARLVELEVTASRTLEQIAFGNYRTQLYRTQPII